MLNFDPYTKLSEELLQETSQADGEKISFRKQRRLVYQYFNFVHPPIHIFSRKFKQKEPLHVDETFVANQQEERSTKPKIFRFSTCRRQLTGQSFELKSKSV